MQIQRKMQIDNSYHWWQSGAVTLNVSVDKCDGKGNEEQNGE